jgi:homoserine kinase
MRRRISVSVPATTANLGPGFDCLALALDLWNTAVFSREGKAWQVRVEGEGADWLPQDENNLVAQAFTAFYRRRSLPLPSGLVITCRNGIPTSSGMGSSAAACLLGLLGASVLSGVNATKEELLEMAGEMEGHADNAAAALYGGLVVLARGTQGWIVRRHKIPPLNAVIALPEVKLSTRQARAALPEQVALADAVHNLGRTALVVDALCAGDILLLAQVMDDRLHQPYRLPLIPGAAEAISAAQKTGAAAALSGAGPAVIAFPAGKPQAVPNAMLAAFNRAGVRARLLQMQSVNEGARVQLRERREFGG